MHSIIKLNATIDLQCSGETLILGFTSKYSRVPWGFWWLTSKGQFVAWPMFQVIV